jgi:hypothetical protein
MRRDSFRDFDLAGRRVSESLVQVLVLDVEFGGELDFGVWFGIRVRRRRHGGREGGGFVLFSSSVLPPRPGESDCVPAELVSGRVYFATFAFVGSIAVVGYSKEGSCRRHLELGRPGYSLRHAETLGAWK